MLLSVVSDQAGSVGGVEAAVEVGAGQQVTAGKIILVSCFLDQIVQYSLPGLL